MTDVTAVLPAYNEEVAIGSMILMCKKHTDRIIVVDDGSTDRTAKVATLAGAEVIVHPKNLGKGAALKTGFEAAKGSWIIVTMDTDGQHNPDDIPRLTAPIHAGDADMVNGSRYLNGHDTDTPAYRRVGQTVLDHATRFNTGLELTDSQSGFRAFVGHSIDSFRFKADNLAIESEMLVDAANAGLRISEVEIGVRYDVDCSSENPVRHGVGVLVRVLKDMEFNKPLYYFTVPGLVMTVFGLILGLGFLRDFYLGASLNFGPTILMIMITLIGTFMTFTGMMLHSISRLIRQCN